jgi:hypothetical protein
MDPEDYALMIAGPKTAINLWHKKTYLRRQIFFG